ncbi:Ig-like domain-containing protein [Chitinophaga cymbidii]|uniref:Por secretion system C-terminal sorting domain-containing protein n=1 Tax=Chitinophaga cymbidii TaxID=1096750 RepID=A0A512RRE9_9BACT|nr:Ig-like domain-containing protein [Chitinophaga cymbidii]GEP98254.1 hypothetical protein CCY01nite_45140 [Chitinophaga cymbidii]
MKKMYKFLFIVACYALLSTNTHAQMVSGNGFLKADYIEAGVRPNGAFGTTVKCPENYFYHTNTSFNGRLGFISDVGKDGWDVGSPAYIGDYFLPGSPYEGFSVQIDGTRHLNSGFNHDDIPGAVTGFSTTDVSQTVEWTGNIGDLEVRQEFSVEKTKGFILIRVYLVNKGTTDLVNVYYTREVDPDNEQTQGGGFNTKNVIEQQNPNAISTALISAQGLSFSSYLGLGSRDCRAKVSVPSGWPNANGSQIWAGTGQRLSAPGNVSGDNAMAIAFKVGTLAAGDSTALAFAYVLNASDLPDAMDRTDPLFNVKTTSYSSGSSIEVCAGQEQIIEVVNGDGFSWTWAPSTGLNTTTGSAVKATLTGPMTYTASGINSCGTTRSITLTLDPSITTPPEDAEAITGQDTVVAGLNASYSIPAVTGASKYNWTLPPGVTFVSGYNTNNITVNFGPSATGGDIIVEGANGCGTGASTTFEVRMINLSAPVSSEASPTSIKKPAITGTARPGMTVTLYDGSTPVGSATADAEGNYSITPTSPLSTGTRTLTMRVDDGAGSTSTASDPLTLVILAKPPKPAAPALVTGTSPLNENKPAIKGTALPNSTVTIYANGTSIGTTTADAAGDWTFTPDEDLADDSYEITVTVKDAEGNESDTSDALPFVIDATLPLKPEMELTGDSSPTQNVQPSLNGTSEASSVVTIYIDGVETGTATTDAAGKWDFALPAALADGAYVFTASATDTAGNISADLDSLHVTIDTQAPVQPAVELTEGSSPVNDSLPSLSGTAEANSTVNIYVDGTIVSTATADADGNWTYTVSSALPDGPHTIYVTATDAAGNTSGNSETLTVEIDTEVPAKPAVELTTGSSPLKENQPALNGTAEPNSTVNIYVDGKVIGTATADATGKWSYTLPEALSDGNHSITTTVTDAAGNTGPASDALDLVIDTQVPVAPTLSGNNNDHSNNNKPAFTGTAEANSTVDIYVDGVLTGTVTADADGKWSYTLPGALADGPHTITTTATDAAGNISASSGELTVIIDTESPAQPAISVSGGPINENQPALEGTAEANSTVDIYVDGVKAGTVTADANGKWTYTVTPALADGPHTISVTTTDAAGNTSAASETLTVEIDTEVPVQPVVELATGSSPLKENQPSLTGTAEPNSTVNIYVDGEIAGTATADATGKWSYTLPSALSDGSHTITTTVTDAAGNTSPVSEALEVEIDTQVPVAPSSPVLSGSSNDHSNSDQPAFTGTAEANSTVDIYVDGIKAGTVTADADGNWSYTLPNALADGEHTITTTATDAAGNTSATGDAITIIVDTKVPVTSSTPVLAAEQNGRTNDNTPTLSGTAEPNTTITVYNNGESIGTATVAADGSWSFTPETALTDGVNTITTTVTDAAGNTSATSEAVSFTVDTQLPVPVVSSSSTAVKGPFQVSIVFDEPVEGFDVSAITLSNATASGFTMISPTEYRITVMPVSENDVTVRVNTGAVPDSAGNGNRESNILTVKAEFSAVVESVFPNPSRGNIYIRFNGVVPSEGTAIMISVSGQTVLRQHLSFQGNMLMVNASGLAQGVYVLMVNTKNYTYKTRVSIIR